MDPELIPPGPVRTHCPWCSAELGNPLPDSCPACGARIADREPDAVIPGVTEVDHDAARVAADAARRIERAGRRLIGLAGEVQSLPPGGPASASAGALAPPSAEVRREMARLRAELAAAEAGTDVDPSAAATTPDTPAAPEPPTAGP